eukprot:8076159-Pyramimonas_sp.AAC.1
MAAQEAQWHRISQEHNEKALQEMAGAECKERCARRSARKEEELQIAVAYQHLAHEHQEEANKREAMRVVLNLEHSAIQAKAHEM